MEVDRREAEQLDVRLRLATFEQAIELHLRGIGEDGEVVSRNRLDSANPVVQIPVGTWHTCVVREPDTVVVEIKPGPFRPNEFCRWAPEEGGAEVEEFLDWIASAEPGQKWRAS